MITLSYSIQRDRQIYVWDNLFAKILTLERETETDMQIIDRQTHKERETDRENNQKVMPWNNLFENFFYTGDRDRQTNRRDRQIHKERETDRQTKRRDRHTHKERDRQTYKERDRETDREREREREREKWKIRQGKQRETRNERDREKDREKQRETNRHRKRERK